jgi:hypothetical protein
MRLPRLSKDDLHFARSALGWTGVLFILFFDLGAGGTVTRRAWGIVIIGALFLPGIMIRPWRSDRTGTGKRVPTFSERLELAGTLTSRFIPQPRPPSWSPPIMPPLLNVLKVVTTDGDLFLWLSGQGKAARLVVAFGWEGSTRKATDAEAVERLREFPQVASFWERSVVDDAFVETYPGIRSWVGNPPEVVEFLAAQERTPPSPCEAEDLDWNLTVSRRHLPKQLPALWSAPVAIKGATGGRDCDSHWSIIDDELLILVGMIVLKTGPRLAVTVCALGDRQLVDEECALQLAYFENVSLWVPAKWPEAEGSRTFLGDVSGTARPGDLN